MRKRIIFAIVALTIAVRKFLLRWDFAYKLLFAPGMTGLRTLLGKWRAWYCFEKARRECPAYGQFLQAHPGDVILRGLTPDFSAIPSMDKANYIKVYSMADRCYGGSIPTKGTVVDTSSGSSGRPTNWLRGNEEREEAARVIQIALRQLLPNQPIMFLNAFALGPWATGMFVSYAVSDESLLVSVGPDVDKIVDIMTDFGPDQFTYVIAGYPPFLKMLADSNRCEWSNYKAMAIYGGEGMSEAMRTYLMGAFRAVYGDYGASDLEVNIGAENDFTIELRRLMAAQPALRQRLNQRVAGQAGCERLAEVLPHIFQYNELDYLIESNAQGELLVTLCRANNVAPKIRYNIHDNGFVLRYQELQQALQAEGISLWALPQADADLPLMFLYGRSDLAVSYYGCKIPPAAIEKIIFELPTLADIYNSFRLITHEDDQHDKHLTLAVELAKGVEPPSDLDTFCLAIFEALARDSQDYRESSRIAAQRGITPKLEFHRFDEGPFVGSGVGLKNRYTEEK